MNMLSNSKAESSAHEALRNPFQLLSSLMRHLTSLKGIATTSIQIHTQQTHIDMYQSVILTLVVFVIALRKKAEIMSAVCGQRA